MASFTGQARLARIAVLALLMMACAEATEVGEAADTAPTPDMSQRDAALPVVLDAAVQPEEELGGLLDPCENGDECRDGYCIQFEDSNVCTGLCRGGDCPEGWGCKSVINAGADVVFICVPNRDTLCEPCTNNTDCGPLGDLCVGSADGRVCGRDCSVQDNCPEGFLCADVEDPAGNAGKQCVPATGQCSCRPDQEGEARDCAKQNEFGICEGVQICGAEGWGLCSADEPIREDCDGADNDCDGRIDEGLDEAPCMGVPNQFGQCTGVGTCRGALGWECEAPLAEREVCDNADNDCNGMIDDGLCFDGNDCTDDICNPEGGCQFPARQGPCDDQNQCTENDLCVEGECTGAELICDDGNDCTADSCDPAGGCVFRDADGSPCETGNLCTQDTCDEGRCVAGRPVQCPQNDACQRFSCDPMAGCVGEPLTGNPCDDDDSCTINDECSNGQCIAGDPRCGVGQPCVNECQGDVNLQVPGLCIPDIPLVGTTCLCVCIGG